jgi:DNA polymerase-3 subunit delta'
LSIETSEADTLRWLQSPWKRLNQARLQERLPHALLIIGQQGCGKRLLADQLAFALLCERPDNEGQRCGECAACGWLRAGTHPDLLSLGPEEDGKAIKVDQIRALCTELSMKSHAGRYKVAMIEPAEAMNVNAANSLLKTLEEPTDSTLLILLSASPGRLPATIRSRCQRIQIATPDSSSAQRWLISRGISPEEAIRCLRLADGAPLKALKLTVSDSSRLPNQRLEQLVQIYDGRLDPLAAAGEWLGETEQQTLEWWRCWLHDMLRWQQAGRLPEDPAMAQKLQQIVERVNSKELFRLADRVSNALNSLGSGLNRQLLLEDLLIFWANLGQGTSPTMNGSG